MNRELAKKKAMSRDCHCVKGKDRDNNYNSIIDEIFDWHESEVKKLSIHVVSGSLLEIDLIDWDHTCGDGCCYTYGQDITLNGEKLDEQNAEDSKNALTAVLTKLGYNVDINYR